MDMLADSVFAVLAGLRAAREHERWGALAREAFLNFAAGSIAVLWPGPALLAFVIISAAWAIATGGAMLFAAFGFRLQHGRAWLALGRSRGLALGCRATVRSGEPVHT